MSHMKKNQNDSDEFDEEYQTYIAGIDKKYKTQMDSNLIRRLSDPPKFNTTLDTSPMKKLFAHDHSILDTPSASLINSQEKWKQENSQNDLLTHKSPLQMPIIPFDQTPDLNQIAKTIKHGKLSDLSKNYFVFYAEPFIFLYVIHKNQFTKLNISEVLSEKENKEKVDFLTLQRFCGHDLLLVLTSDLCLTILLINKSEEEITFCRFEPKLTQKIKTKTFFFKNGCVYYRHENEVHSVKITQLPDVIPQNFIGENTWNFYSKQFERFDSFDVSDNAKTIYVLNNDRISVNSSSFLMHVFKPKLEINEHIKLIKCLHKDVLLPIQHDHAFLNDFIFTLTNMNKLMVHDASLMNKTSELEFRIGKFDLVEIFNLKNIEGYIIDFRIFALANLVVLRHSHLKDFLCLTINSKFLIVENSDLLLLPTPLIINDPIEINTNKDNYGKSTSSIQRMSEQKKSNLGKNHRVFTEDFFILKFVIANCDYFNVLNYTVSCFPEQKIGSNENKNNNWVLTFFGIDSKFDLFLSSFKFNELICSKFTKEKNLKTELTVLFDKHANLNTNSKASQFNQDKNELISNTFINELITAQNDTNSKNNKSDKVISNHQISIGIKSTKQNNLQNIDSHVPIIPKQRALNTNPQIEEEENENNSLPMAPQEISPKDVCVSENTVLLQQTEKHVTKLTDINSSPLEFLEFPKLSPDSNSDPLIVLPQTSVLSLPSNKNQTRITDTPNEPANDPKSITKTSLTPELENPPTPKNPSSENPKKLSKSETKIQQKKYLEFVKNLNDTLMEYHNEALTSVKSFMDDFKKLFIDEIKTSISDNAKIYNKNNFEHIFRSIENSLNPTFEKSVKNVIEKYTGMCEKAVSKLTHICNEEQTAFQILQNDVSNVLNSQSHSAQQIKEYTDIMVQISSETETQRPSLKIQSDELSRMFHFVSKLSAHQKSLGDNLKIITEKLEIVEKNKLNSSVIKASMGYEQQANIYGNQNEGRPAFYYNREPLVSNSFYPPHFQASRQDDSFYGRGYPSFVPVPSNRNGPGSFVQMGPNDTFLNFNDPKIQPTDSKTEKHQFQHFND